jgi:uncharacterized damage-inducible protein DinB
MKKVLCLALVLLCASVVVAQQAKPGSAASANPVSDTVRNMLGGREKNLVGAAEAMPADKYSYKPTEQQMSFGALVAHSADGNNFYCSKLANQPQPEKVGHDAPKDKLVAELKKSFDYCQSALKGVQDSQLGEQIDLFGGKQGPKAAAIIGLASGWADHYGAAAIYLRLNGILPPTAQKATEPEKK